MKLRNRMLAVLLTVAMVLSMLPVAFAAEQATVTLISPAGSKQVTVTVGEEYTFTAAEEYEGYQFSAWTTEPVKATDGSDVEYFYFVGETLKIDGDRTFYALYAYVDSELDEPCFYWTDNLDDYTGEYALVGYDADFDADQFVLEYPLAMGENGQIVDVVNDLGATVDVENDEFFTKDTGIAFSFKKQSNGTYTIQNLKTKKYLSVSNNAMAFVNSPDNYSYWNIVLDVEGFEYIFNAKNSDLVLLYDYVDCQFALFDDSKTYLDDGYPTEWFTIYLHARETAIYMFTTEIKGGTVVDPTEPTEPQPTDPTEPTNPTEPAPLPADYVAIYNVASSVVMTTESSVYNNKEQLLPAAATLNGDKLSVASDKVALFKLSADASGNVSFITEDGKYLEADGTNLRFVEAANENTQFVLEEAENGYCLRLANYVYVDGNGDEKAQYIEYYASKEVFTVYGMGADLDLYVFDFYAVESTEDPTEPEQPTEPEETVKPIEGCVAIYNVANSKIMTTESNVYNNKEQLLPGDATLTEGKLSTTNTNVAQFYMTTDAEGITTFQLSDGRYLEADGTNLRFVEAANENTEFVLEPAENGYYIRLANYVYVDSNGNEKAQYIEYYAAKEVFTVYGMGSDTTMYEFDFYPLSGEAIPGGGDDSGDDQNPEEGTKPIEGCVAIYNVANSRIMTTEVSTYTSSSGNSKEQILPAAATLDGGKLSTIASNAAQFYMSTDEEGLTTFKLSDGRYLEADGTNLRFVDAANENTQFVLEPTVGGYYIRLANYVYVDSNGNEKPQYIEYYAAKEVFTVFGMGTDYSMYVFDFYPLEGDTTPAECEHEWNEGEVTTAPTCETTGEKTYTCALCGETKTEELEKLPCASDNFPDLNPEYWYHDGIDFMLNKGYMNGMGEGLFLPDSSLSRAMVATVLYRIAGEPEVEGTTEFTDVLENAWYTKAVIWAQSQKIVTGYTDGTFQPNKSITRQEMALMLARYAKLSGVELTDGADLSVYPDADSVAAWAEEAVAWCVANDIINGVQSEGVSSLKPGSNATRAQFAVIIMRYLTKE